MVPQAAREHAVRQSRLTDDKSNSDATAPSAVPTTKYWAFLCADGFQRESQADERRDMLPSPATRRVHAHQTPSRLSLTLDDLIRIPPHTHGTQTHACLTACVPVCGARVCVARGAWPWGVGSGVNHCSLTRDRETAAAAGAGGAGSGVWARVLILLCYYN